MTTDLMLRGFESRTIRQPPPAPCATGVCGTRETTTDRRLAGGSSLFFPPASAVCRSVQAFDWRRAWAIRGTAMAIAAGASASGGGTCGPTATSAIGPSTTSSRHRIHTASSWTRPSPWREAARSRTTTAARAPMVQRHQRHAQSGMGARARRPPHRPGQGPAAHRANPIRADPMLGLVRGWGVDPTRPRRATTAKRRFSPGLFPHLNGGRLGVQNVEDPSLEERVEVP